MDHFGIGNGLRGATRIYFQSGRRTGRTTSLIDSLKGGERVICSEPRDAERIRRACRERDIRVDVIVQNPTRLHALADLPKSEGRTLFDHSWVESFYMRAFEQATQDVDHWQHLLSGDDAKHEPTSRAGEEVMRWG
jgi:hypothetical protein